MKINTLRNKIGKQILALSASLNEMTAIIEKHHPCKNLFATITTDGLCIAWGDKANVSLVAFMDIDEFLKAEWSDALEMLERYSI